MPANSLFWAFLHENDKNRILTFFNCQYMIARITMKGFIIMRLTAAKQFKNHECLSRSNGQLSGSIYTALKWADIIELRPEGP